MCYRLSILLPDYGTALWRRKILQLFFYICVILLFERCPQTYTWRTRWTSDILLREGSCPAVGCEKALNVKSKTKNNVIIFYSQNRFYITHYDALFHRNVHTK